MLDSSIRIDLMRKSSQDGRQEQDDGGFMDHDLIGRPYARHGNHCSEALGPPRLTGYVPGGLETCVEVRGSIGPKR